MVDREHGVLRPEKKVEVPLRYGKVESDFFLITLAEGDVLTGVFCGGSSFMFNRVGNLSDQLTEVI